MLPLAGWPCRVATILFLFAAQGLWLTVTFDTGAMAESSVTWGWLFRTLPILPRIGICLLISIPLIGRSRILGHAQNFASVVRDHRAWVSWWTGQWIAFAALIFTSSVIFDETPVDAPGAAWIAGWIAAAIACCLCCLFAVAPPGFWWRFCNGERWVILAGLATSLGAAYGGRLFQILWNPLGEFTFYLVGWWLSFPYADSIVSDPELRLLGTEAFYVQIAPQCSGYEGIGLVSVFILVFLAVFRQTLRFPRAWLLLPVGILLIWVCNSLRIAALIVIGTEYSASIAMGGFHSQAGWILFNLVSLGLMAGALRSEFFTHTMPRVEIETTTSAAPYLFPFLVLSALSMFLAALVLDPAALYPLVVLVSIVTLWNSRRVIRQLDWRWSAWATIHGCGVFVIWTGLAWVESHFREIHATPLPRCDTVSGITWTIFRIFGAVVTVPIIEELAFRGFLLRRLAKADFEKTDYTTVPLWAILVSSLGFGLLHQLWLGGVVAGLSYAWVTRTRGNLACAIQAHAITNALLALTVVSTGATWLW